MKRRLDLVEQGHVTEALRVQAQRVLERMGRSLRSYACAGGNRRRGQRHTDDGAGCTAVVQLGGRFEPLTPILAQQVRPIWSVEVEAQAASATRGR